MQIRRILLALGTATLAAVAPAQEVDWEALLEGIRPSIIQLETEEGAPIGMGCVLARPDFVLTTGQTWEIGHTLMGVTHEGLRIKLSVLSYFASRDLVLLQGTKAVAPPMPGSVTRQIESDTAIMAVSPNPAQELVLTPGRVTAAENARSGVAVILADFSSASGLLGAPVFDEWGQFAGLVASRRIDIPDNIIVATNEIGIFVDEYRRAPSMVPTNVFSELTIPSGAGPEERESILTFNRGVTADKPNVKIYHYQRATAIRPGFHEAWFNLGIMHQSMGDNEAALTALETAWSLSPNSVRTARALGELALTMELWDRAEQMLSKAVEFEPDNTRQLNALGEVLILRGKHVEAVERFSQALLLSPDYTPTLFNLAQAYRELGEAAEAKTLYERYLELAPRGEYANVVHSALEALAATSKTEGKE